MHVDRTMDLRAELLVPLGTLVLVMGTGSASRHLVPCAAGFADHRPGLHLSLSLKRTNKERNTKQEERRKKEEPT